MSDTAPPPRSEIPADVAARVVAVVAASRGLLPEQVGLDATLLDLGIDSLDGLELFFDLEEAFDVKIPDEVARQVVTVRDIAERLASHFGPTQAGEGA
jgi:acyl carrier protein